MKKKEKQWKRIMKRAEKRMKIKEPEIICKSNKKFTLDFHDKEIDKLFMPLEIEVIEE